MRLVCEECIPACRKHSLFWPKFMSSSAQVYFPEYVFIISHERVDVYEALLVVGPASRENDEVTHAALRSAPIHCAIKASGRRFRVHAVYIFE
jgi:hypothetical protein